LENVMKTMVSVLLAFAVGCSTASEWPSASRPYKNRRDLVRKGVLSEAKFDRIRGEVDVDHEKE